MASWNWANFDPKITKTDNRDRDGAVSKAEKFVEKNLNELALCSFVAVPMVDNNRVIKKILPSGTAPKTRSLLKNLIKPWKTPSFGPWNSGIQKKGVMTPSLRIWWELKFKRKKLMLSPNLWSLSLPWTPLICHPTIQSSWSIFTEGKALRGLSSGPQKIRLVMSLRTNTFKNLWPKSWRNPWENQVYWSRFWWSQHRQQA